VGLWEAVGALASLGAAGAAAVGAFQSRASAREANAAARQSASAAAALTAIERDRRRSELTPRFRVTCEPANPGTDALTLRVMLLGPPALHRLESLTVAIRDDLFQRAEIPPLAGGPTPEQVKEHIWGPYRFTPGTGPGAHARADETGRVTACGPLPVGEGLTFHLEPTRPGQWMTGTTDPDWRRMQGTVIRLLLDARIDDDWWWILRCEIETGPPPRGRSVAVQVPDE
jgi:hypothetical protein